MCVLNDLDRFHLVMDVIERVPGFGGTGGIRSAANRGKADTAVDDV
jgi:hypothetical protein